MTMRLARGPLSRLYFLGVAFVMAWHTTLPFVAVYAKSLGASPPVVGLLISATAFLPLLLGIYIGAAVDALGTIRVARLSAVVFTAAFAVMAVSRGLGQLAAALCLVGFADIGLVVASQTHVAVHSTPADRHRNFGYYSLWVSLGALLGPLFGGFLAGRWSYHAVFAGSAVLGLITAVVSWTLPVRREMRLRPLADYGGRTIRITAEMIGNRRILMILLLNACTMFAFSLRQSFYPVYLQGIGFSTMLIGLIFSFSSLCGMAVRPMLGVAVQRFGHARILGVAIVLTAAGVLITPLLANAAALALAFGAVGMAMGLIQPLSMSVISGEVAAERRGIALGLRISANHLAQVVGPPILGLVVAGAGIGTAFCLAAAVAGTGMLALRGFVRSGACVPERDALAEGGTRASGAG